MGIAYLKTSKALYLFKYFIFRLYARKYSAGFFTEKVFFPISLMTSGASWNIGSKTRRFLDPSSFLSKPTMVMEWPLIVRKGHLSALSPYLDAESKLKAAVSSESWRCYQGIQH